MTTSDNSRRLTAYRKRLEEAGFKRVSAYVSLDLVAYLQSQKVQGECIGRTLERLLLGEVKVRPQYYSDDEIAQKEARRSELLEQRTKNRKVARVEQRVLRRAEWELLRMEAMERLGLLKKPEI